MQPLARNGYTESEVLNALRGRRGTRTLSFRYDLLGSNNEYLSRLDNVLSCQISHNALADIKRTARFRIRDDDTINYLSNRIQPWVRLHMPPIPDDEPQNYPELVEAVGAPLLRYTMDDAPGQTTVANSSEAGSACNLTASATGMTGHAGLIAGQSLRFNNERTTVTPTIRDTNSNYTTSVTAAWELPFPAGTQVGDLAIAATMGTSASGVHVAQPGWNYLQSTPEDIGSRQVCVAWKIVEEGDTGFPEASETNQNWVGTVVIYEAGSFDPDNPIAVEGTREIRSSTTNLVSAPSINYSEGQTELLGIFLESSAASSTFTPPSGTTLLDGAFSEGATEISSHVVRKELSGSGSTGSMTATFDVNGGTGTAFGMQLIVSSGTAVNGDYAAGTCNDFAGKIETPTFFGAETASHQSGDTITVPLPVGWRAGDLAILAVNVNDDQETVTAPNGWTVLDSGPVETGSLEVGIWWRLLEAGDADPTVEVTDAQKLAGAVVVYRGVDQMTPIAATGTAGTRSSSSTDITAGSVTTTAAGQRVVGVFAEKSSTATEVAVPGMNERAAVFTTGGGAASIAVFDEVAAAAGGTGDRTATYDVASGSGYGLLLAVAGSSTQRTEFTVSAWYRATSTNNDGVIFAAVDPDDGTRYLELRWDDVGDLSSTANCVRAAVTLDDDTVVAVESESGVQDRALTHIVMTWESGIGITLYLNGRELGFADTDNLTASGALHPSATRLLFGGDGVNIDAYWDGYIDDVTIWPEVLPVSVINDLYRAGARLGPYGDEQFVEFAQGVFMLSTPRRVLDEAGTVVREVEAYDTTKVVVDDVVTDRYAAVVGDLYTTTIDALLGSIPANITPSLKTIPVTREWEPGTSKLQIINDLLEAINYESLWFDEHGTAVCRPYVAPGSRAVEFVYADDADSVTLPEVTHTLDLFDIPNKWVFVVSNPDRAALTSTVINDDPASITSTVARDRTITDFRTDVDAADQTALDEFTERVALEASQVFDEVEFETALMPMHSHNDVYTFTMSGLTLNHKYSETGWEMRLEAGTPMRHKIRRVIDVSLSVAN